MKKFLFAIVIVIGFAFAGPALAQTGSDSYSNSNSGFSSDTNTPAGGVRVILPGEEALPQSSGPDAQSNSTILYVLAAAFLLIVGIVVGISVYSSARSKPYEKDNQKL